MSTPCLIVVKLDLMTTADLTINDGCIKINLCLLKYSDPPPLSLSLYWSAKIYDIAFSLDMFHEK